MTQPTQSDSLRVYVRDKLFNHNPHKITITITDITGKHRYSLPWSELQALYAPKPDETVEGIIDKLIEGCDVRIDEGQAYLHESSFAKDEAITTLAAHYAAKEQEAVLRARIEAYEDCIDADAMSFRNGLDFDYETHCNNRIADLTNQLNQMKGNS